MQIVLNVPEEVYIGIISKGNFISDFNLSNAFMNAIILPKGHGRLADLDAALKCVEDTADCDEKFYAMCLFDWAMSKRVVLEADKE